MSVHFKLSEHLINFNVTDVCEIWIGDKIVGTIYPQEPASIQLLSRHLVGGHGGLIEATPTPNPDGVTMIQLEFKP